MIFRKWLVTCTTDGEVPVWSASQPTACPNDPGHTVTDVTDTMLRADDAYYFIDTNDDVWKVIVGTDGIVVTAKQT